jgi:Fe2+ or Zn2+ uptake regulation protein
VTEIEDRHAEHAVLQAAQTMRFQPEKVVVEVEGVCNACAAVN